MRALCATCPYHRVLRRVTLVLSNLSCFILEERLRLCAEPPNNCHTFGRLEASVCLILPIILRLEPRASSPLHRCPCCSTPMTVVDQRVQRVYPGCVYSSGCTGCVYSPGCTGCIYTRVYLSRYPTRVYPSGYPTRVYHRVYMGCS